MSPGMEQIFPGDSGDTPPSREGEYSSEFPTSAVSLSTALLNLFGSGAFSFWHWETSSNELSTFGALKADSLEDWMTRIHPRDQAEFSAFIDRGNESGQPSNSIEYRFSTNRQGDWIRVRQTANLPESGAAQSVGSLVCLIETLSAPGGATGIEDLVRQIKSSGTDTTQAQTGVFSGFVSADSFAAHPPLQEDGVGGESVLRSLTPPQHEMRSDGSYRLSEKRAMEEKGLKGSTILLVEDEAAVRKLVRKLLEMLGCSVIESPSGRQALNLWPEVRDRVSLVVSDIVMPDGVSGWDLAKELHHRHPALPILLTSGYSEFAEDHDLINHPRIAFLQKPYQIKSLRNTLCRLTRETVSCCPK